MYIFELTYTGSFLDFPEKEVGFEIQQLLYGLEGILTEAAISLSMFESFEEKKSIDKNKWKKDAELRSRISNEIREDAGEDYFENFEKYHFLAEKKLREEKIRLGDLPQSYKHKIPFIHAHTFVYAVDSFGKFIEELSDYEGASKSIQNCVDKFNEELPSVRKIRNSTLHIEDRSRGYGPPWDKKKGKKMNLSGFLGLSNLENNFLCYTIDDGSYQRVEISIGVFELILDLAQKTIDSFNWQGHPRIVPTF